MKKEKSRFGFFVLGKLQKFWRVFFWNLRRNSYNIITVFLVFKKETLNVIKVNKSFRSD